MKGEEELKRVYEDQRIINMLLQRKKDLAEKMVSINSPAGTLTSPRVQTSHRNDNVDTILIQIEDITLQALERVNELEKRKSLIMDNLERLPDEAYKDVLFYRYLCFMKWKDIADKLQITLRYVHKLHAEALTEYEKIAAE